MPDLPHPKLRADGWIIDPYGFDRKRFRRYLMKYLVTGKPVINCITASPDPGAPFGITSQEQVDVCREFNVPMFFYCVDPKWGSPAVWLHSDDPAIAKCREWLLKVVDEAHRTDTTQLPLSTANYSTGQPIEVAGDENNHFVYLDDFSTLQFVDDATIRGFLNLRWDGIAESLSVEPRDQRVNSVQLIYHFQSEFEMYDMQAELSGELVSTSGVKTSLALSLNGWRWEDEQSIEIPKVTRRTARRLRKQPFTLISSFRNRAGYRSNEFWVRVQVELPQAYKRRVTKRKGLS
ncbi:MAG TPA: hypothetical protein EYP10_06905, partial [Armatimonadetes bacterium]|nr:hypothetical protein [Armatimonadota bacterium]